MKENKVGQPTTTWRRMVETERDKLGMNSWARANTEKQYGGVHVPPGMKRIGEVIEVHYLSMNIMALVIYYFIAKIIC
jgi:hypothetical protein